MAESKKNAKTEKTEVPQVTGNATGLRIGAVILWILAIGFEVLALLTAIGKIFTGLSSTMRIVVMIGFIVLDLIALIVGSALWKKSNKIDPASEKNKLKFWLWNNLGVIVAAFAFIPFIILVLINKDTDKKTKAFASVVAVIALLIGGLASYDWNPISAEQLQAAKDNIKGEVYATSSGSVYHIKYKTADGEEKYCQYIVQDGKLKDNVITFENVEKAIKEGGYVRLCKTCAKRNNLYGLGINIDGGDIVDDAKDAVSEAVDAVSEAIADTGN